MKKVDFGFKILKIFLKVYIKIYKKIINFCNTEVEKHKFHQSKSPIPINNGDINKILLSNKVCFGKKDFEYFIAYFF